MPREISDTLRKDYVGEIIYKTCSKCHKTYPRTPKFFYRKDHQLHPRNYYRYESSCVKCVVLNTMKWAKENPEKRKIAVKLYKESEHGFFKTLWNAVRYSKHGNEFKNFEEFLKCWKDQQEIYGRKCPYTGVEMTMERFKSSKTKIVKTITNISIDRILSTKPYNPKNLMFISWGVNAKKGNIDTKTAKKFLQFVVERYGTDEIE